VIYHAFITFVQLRVFFVNLCAIFISSGNPTFQKQKPILQPMKKLLILLFPALFTLPLSAQPGIFVPQEVRQAYDAGTRTPEGKPGPNYWQNYAEYDIEVSVDPETKKLTGSEEVVFTNNSPDALNRFAVHLLYNLYKPGVQRDRDLPEMWRNEGVQIKNLRINGQEIDLVNGGSVRTQGTVMTVRLPEPLAPGEQLTFETEWEELIPPGAGRVGCRDSTSCFVGYWYPQIAVYDDVEGWDTDSHTGMAEFYSNLASYEVSVTIPDNYAVWATGVLQNAEAVFPEAIHERYQQAMASDDPVTIIGPEELSEGLQMQSNTWRFAADSVPDFAFAFSDHYRWDAVGLTVDGRRVLVGSAYPEETAEAFASATQWQREIMDFFSTEIPAVPYPYPAFTTFNGSFGGGMEFPMMANNAAPSSRDGMIGLLAHEMYHMWVPFYIRINEKKYAWMDEGWASFMDSRAVDHLNGEEPKPVGSPGLKRSLERSMGILSNVPLMVASNDMSESYGYSSYSHPAFIYEVLAEVLGEDALRTAQQEYFRRWRYKSPTPYDFFFTVEEATGQDLDWFWDPWFFKFGGPDLAIESVNGNEVTITSPGNKPVPLDLTVIYGESDTVGLRRSAEIWRDAQKVTIRLPKDEKPERIVLNETLPDLNDSDNYYPEKPKVDLSALRPYSGNYEVPAMNASVNFRPTADGLLADPGGSQVILLMPTEEKDTFRSADGAIRLSFQRDEANEVSGFKMMLGNQEIEGDKMR